MSSFPFLEDDINHLWGRVTFRSRANISILPNNFSFFTRYVLYSVSEITDNNIDDGQRRTLQNAGV